MREITAELLASEEKGLTDQINALQNHLAETQSALEQAKGALRSVLAFKAYQAQEEEEKQNG